MYKLDYKKYAETARQLSAESCVLLKNNNILPIKDNETISIFGRVQIDTYYCGTGSGGMVNLPYLVTIADGLAQKRKINEELLSLYKNFIKENPFDKGQGWAQEPWSQIDMELSDEIVKNAREKSDIAIITIGRSAGEDKDSSATKGSYYLTETEEHNIELICNYFEKTVILLNTGGILDMSFIEKYNPGAVLYAWHGGCESGNAYADVLCGDVNPCGSLSDTIAKDINDYPSTKNFGDPENNIYEEDIYVGYRYFETFAKDKVLFPFGFGLSYTNFEVINTNFLNDIAKITIKNTGSKSGKKALQIYVQAPNGVLGKANKVLVGFAKTKILEPNESEEISIKINEYDYSSYNEETSTFVLEKGTYKIHAGFDVRNTKIISTFILPFDREVLKCNSALAPTVQFNKLKADEQNKLSYNQAITRKYDIVKRIEDERKDVSEKTNFGYTFDDIKSGKITIKEFANELTNLDLIHLTRGEGMCSPKVTAGTAGCYGAVTDRLKALKMPIACCSDGPSGIRMDNGAMAFSIANGTAIACTFNTELVSQIFEFMAIELLKNKVDTLLGCGMNIHRNPLCGRNFEYSSEDPFLTGKMAVAELKTFHKYGVTGTIKHFACNSQELKRKQSNSQLSERALREIYLKAFEMAVKEADAFSIMSAYNPINGIQSASNFDLTTTILRKDWGFKGVVMTDWWATMNHENSTSSGTNTCDMILSQNDVYMVNADAKTNSNGDNTEEELAKGNISRFELLRAGENIIYALLKLPCSKNAVDVQVLNEPKQNHENTNEIGLLETNNIDYKKIITKKGTLNNFAIKVQKQQKYSIKFDLFANATELAQVPMSVTINAQQMETIILKGGTNAKREIIFSTNTNIESFISLFFGETGMIINSITIEKCF